MTMAPTQNPGADFTRDAKATDPRCNVFTGKER